VPRRTGGQVRFLNGVEATPHELQANHSVRRH
jgi:hypothetical protein